jgi:Domain of unknown function (DUF5753)
LVLSVGPVPWARVSLCGLVRPGRGGRRLTACRALFPRPSGAGAPRGAGPFTILRFSEPDLPDLVYLEQLTSALYLDKRETVDHYLAAMEHLCVEALPASDSMAMISAMLQG